MGVELARSEHQWQALEATVSRVSVLVPTRGRPDNVRRLMESGHATAELPPEFLFYLDEDDPTFGHTVDVIYRLGGDYVVGSRIVLSEMWNRLAEVATHDVVMHCGDDIIFRTQQWDAVATTALGEWPDRLGVVHGRDGYQDANMATHGFYHRRWIETLGYLVPPHFASDYNDLWNTQVADALGRRRYLPEIYTEHMHPVAGKGELDQTHRERLARHAAEDCDGLWRRTAPERERDVAKLRAAIDDHARSVT